MKKAYSVQADDAGCVIFADHNVVARRHGANELGCEFEEVDSCRRAPEFDQYAETGVVPTKVMIEAGWWFECHHCSRTVNQDTEDAHYARGDTVFCSERCVHADATEQAMDKLLAQAAIDCVCEKWPGTTPSHVSGFRLEPRHVSFTFPGGKSPVNWTIGEDSMYISVEDHPAWAIFTGKPVEIVDHRRR